jgi:hypothetical protein
VSRSLMGDEEYVYRGVVEWRRPDGTLVSKYVGPFVNGTAAFQAANREIGSGTFHGWDEDGNRLHYEFMSQRVERAPLTWSGMT